MDIKLPSGRTLQVQLAPFAKARDLSQALLFEMQAIPLSSEVQHMQVLKDLVCRGFSSKLIEQHVQGCLDRCTIDKLKITDDSFEKEEHRQDYIIVVAEVVKANVTPFAKSLYAEYKKGSELMVMAASQK